MDEHVFIEIDRQNPPGRRRSSATACSFVLGFSLGFFLGSWGNMMSGSRNELETGATRFL